MLLKKLILTTFFICLFSINANASNKSTIDKVEKYLNSITTLKAEFTQKTGNSQKLSGIFFLKSPGKLRFQYNNPIKDFIVADGDMIHYYDAELQQHSSTDIENTLAYFLLQKDIKLSGDLTPTAIKETNNEISITITKKDEELSGSLTVYFSKNPMTLKKWEIVDIQGIKTSTYLSKIESGIELNNEIFFFYDPNRKGASTLR